MSLEEEYNPDGDDVSTIATIRSSNDVLTPQDLNASTISADVRELVVVDKKLGVVTKRIRPPVGPSGSSSVTSASMGEIADVAAGQQPLPPMPNRGKYKTVKSSGYGRGVGGGAPAPPLASKRRTRSSTMAYSSDDETASVRSTGSHMQRRMQGSSGKNSRRRSQSVPRQRTTMTPGSGSSLDSDLLNYTDGLSSAPRARAGSADGGNPPSNTSSVSRGEGGGSSWAQKQREQQRQRQARSQARNRRNNDQPQQPPSLSVDVNQDKPPTLKRTAVMASPAMSEVTYATALATPPAEEVSNKSMKVSALSSPSSASTKARLFHYNGANSEDEVSARMRGATAAESCVEHPSCADDTASRGSVSSSFRRTANGLIASLKSPPKPRQGGRMIESRVTRDSPVTSTTSIRHANGTTPVRRRTPNVQRVRSGRLDAEVSDLGPVTSEIRRIAEELFATGTGISDGEIKKVLNSRAAGGKQWELRKKLDALQNVIRRVKDTLNSLLEAKNNLCDKAIKMETGVRTTLIHLKNKAEKLDDECRALGGQVKRLDDENRRLKDDVKDARREGSQFEEKNAGLEAQVEALKEALAAAEKKHTEVALKLALAEGRSEEATKQAESWRVEIASVEASKSEAVKQAETTVAATLERNLSELREECAALRTKIQAREDELGRVVSEGKGKDPIANIRDEMDRIRERATEAESQLALRTSELEKALVDKEAAMDRAAAKETDMSELMKSIGDIQRSAQAREDESNSTRKEAEEKAFEANRLLAEARGEISVLIHEKGTLKDALDAAKVDLTAAEKNIQQLKNDILEQRNEFSEQSAQVQVERGLRARAEEKELEERRERIALSAQMVAMTKDHAKVEAQLKEANESNERSWRDKFEGQKDTIIELEKKISLMKETVTGLKAERGSLKDALNDRKNMADAHAVEENGRLRGEINVLKERMASAQQQAVSFGQASAEQVRALESQIREGQAERRRMHNTIQELRGNVRVFARVRPFLPGDGVGSDAEPCVVPKTETDLKIGNCNDGRDYSFSFDRVFPPSVGQEAVFEEVSEFVQSALDGYNVCLFSYGQTGSGKTHTMQGSGVGQMRGIIPRAIEQVGRYKETLEIDGWKYDMKVSFLEIYNETIRDLLRDDRSNECKHEIKVLRDGSRHITDLTVQPLEPTDQAAIEAVMRQAAKHRSVASTDMNAVSSRSHSVFTLHLTAVHSEQRQSLKGMLNLVDLAGSERLDRSGAVGDRAKEAMSINKSLSSLTDVFAAIGKKASHIPFRNSKLTYLLQPSLSGDGKTLMMANLSPTDESFQESMCSLRFASTVNQCELGKPRRALSETTDDGGNKAPIQRSISAASPKKKAKPSTAPNPGARRRL